MRGEKQTLVMPVEENNRDEKQEGGREGSSGGYKCICSTKKKGRDRQQGQGTVFSICVFSERLD